MGCGCPVMVASAVATSWRLAFMHVANVAVMSEMVA